MLALEHDRGRVAVAHQQLNVLTVGDGVGLANGVRATDTTTRLLIDIAAVVVVRCVGVNFDALVFQVPLGSRQATVVAGQLVAFVATGSAVVAIQHIALVLVYPHINRAFALCIKLFDTRIAVDRVEGVGVNITEELFAGNLVTVCGGSEKILALDRALGKKGNSPFEAFVSRCIAFAPVAQRLFQLGADDLWAVRIGLLDFAEVDAAFCHPDQ